MGKVYESISDELADWIAAQKVFFVATAPLAGDGLINCSPKGMDTLRVLGPNRVAYLDLTGSGVETIAHLRENGRMVLMWCAFDGPPKIVRLHGTGRVVTDADPEFAELRPRFPEIAGGRAIVVLEVTRVGDSCGFAVPKMEFVGERDTLARWAESKGPDGLVEYRAQKNAASVEGLPGL